MVEVRNACPVRHGVGDLGQAPLTNLDPDKVVRWGAIQATCWRHRAGDDVLPTCPAALG